MATSPQRKAGLSMRATDMLLHAGSQFPTPKDTRWKDLWESQRPIVEKELYGVTKADQQRTMEVLQRMLKEPEADVGGKIDWDEELAKFQDLDYPSYYLLPFHSNLGGWLSINAAVNDRRAMDAIYTDCHPQKCFGVRAELAKFVPSDSRVVVDLGSGVGDGPAAVANLLPDCRVVAVEASPFMITVGRRQSRNVPNLEFHHALAEATGLEAGSADCITITLVFHECSDEGKSAIIAEAYRVLKSGGTFIFSDTPQVGDLQTYRGFHEPWQEQWLKFDTESFLASAGFVDQKQYDVTAPHLEGGFQVRPTQQRLFTQVAKKPASPASRM